MDGNDFGLANVIANGDMLSKESSVTEEKPTSEVIVAETIATAFQFAREVRLSRRGFARWLCDWFQDVSPELLIKWLCLNTQQRREAEANLVAFMNRHTGLVVSTKRILRQNSMSRNTQWPKTLEKGFGLPMPVAYYNRIRYQIPNRFMYGALRWLASSWKDELERFRQGVNDAEARLELLQQIEDIPVIAQSPMLPFSVCHLMKLHEMGEKGDVEARKLVESLQALHQLDCKTCEEDNELLDIVQQRCQEAPNDNDAEKTRKKDNINNLFELLVILKSVSVLKKDGWVIDKADIDPVTSKPIIAFVGEGLKAGFGCRISKGGIANLDSLSKRYRSRNASGFEPDVVYIFYREAAGSRDAVMFLGDAKNYSVSNHGVAVRDKLLNVFAFARALGIRIHGYGDDGELIEWHKSEGNEPIPSFMLFFPTFEDNEERAFRNVMERFSLACFSCDEQKRANCCQQFDGKQCPGSVRDSFHRIFNLIKDEKFVWLLRMTEEGALEFNPTAMSSKSVDGVVK